jgi:hypothetical protein
VSACLHAPLLLLLLLLLCPQATLNFAKDVLKGTWKPVRNDPPTEKQEVGPVGSMYTSRPSASWGWKYWEFT